MAQVDAAVHELLQKLHVRDIAIQQLKERCDLMQEDYEHNFRLLQQQTAELQSLRAQVSVKDKQLMQLDSRCTVQSAKLREGEGEVQRQTQALQSTVESLRSQLQVAQNEHQTSQRRCTELDLELVSLRQEIQQQSSKMARHSEVARREALMEAETVSREKERGLRLREEQLLRDLQNTEQRFTEISSEYHRLKEAKDTSDIRVEELNKIVARKEFLLQQAQEQLNEMKKQHAQQLSKVELEVHSNSVIREQQEKSNSSQLLAAQRELERRVHETELLEQKMVSLKSQHELELKRRAAERDELLRAAEDKCQALSERLRESEAQAQTARDEVMRLERKVQDLKRSQSQSSQALAHQEERVEEAAQSITQRDQEIRRLRMELERVQAQSLASQRESDELRAEFERRSWQDRVAEGATFDAKKAQYRSVGESKLRPAAMSDETSAAAFGNQPPSFVAPSPIAANNAPAHHQSHFNSFASSWAPPATDAVVRSLVALQQQGPSAAQTTQNQSSGSAAQTSTMSMQRELALLREQHELERRQLERRLNDVQRSATREAIRLQKWGSSAPTAHSSAHSSASRNSHRASYLQRQQHLEGGYVSSEEASDADADTTMGDAETQQQQPVKMHAQTPSRMNTMQSSILTTPLKSSESTQQQHLNNSMDGRPPIAQQQTASTASSRVAQLQKQLAASPIFNGATTPGPRRQEESAPDSK